ncbi:MAG: DUF4290 domain-containing protein [Alphaproteobacteria bacterium]|nr:DUF4290 domain-containing protein [Alphaproteobacteria bacterium]
MEYNSSRNHLSIKEYGRHVQKMVENLRSIEDPDKRQNQAELIIELMGHLNPNIKLAEDYKQKLWDHLFIIADFNLDVKSPFPIPSREMFKIKPKPLPYPEKFQKHRHLGRNLIKFVDLAIQEPENDKKNYYAHLIAYYMKLAYSNYHKELVHDETIRVELKNISGGKLEFSSTPYVRHNRTVEREEHKNSKWTNRNRNNSRGFNPYFKNRPDKKNSTFKTKYF